MKGLSAGLIFFSVSAAFAVLLGLMFHGLGWNTAFFSVFWGLIAAVLAYFATSWQMGFAIPMMIGTTVAAVSVFVAMLFSPETKGTHLVSDIQLA